MRINKAGGVITDSVDAEHNDSPEQAVHQSPAQRQRQRGSPVQDPHTLFMQHIDDQQDDQAREQNGPIAGDQSKRP